MPSSPAQPINVNIYLPDSYGAAAAVAAPAALTTAQIAARQIKQGAQLRLQLKAQDKQINELLQDAHPKQAAAHLSNANIEAALSSAVSDMSRRLHTQNPIQLAAQLGVANPVNVHEHATKKIIVPRNRVVKAGAPKAVLAKMTETPVQAAAVKAAYFRKVEEIDGLLLKGKKTPGQLKNPAKIVAKLGNARTQVLADGSAQEQMAAAEATEEAMQHHTQLVQALAGGQVRQLAAGAVGDKVDHPSLDQEESNSFFRGQQGVRLPGGQATKLKQKYHSQMVGLSQAAGDAETMKITGSISDLIPQSLFHAMNRQNVINEMAHPTVKNKGFPLHHSESVFGHSIEGDSLKLPSDDDVIKENNRMLSSLELAAGYKTPTAQPQTSQHSGDGWGEHYSHETQKNKGWNSQKWRGSSQSADSAQPVDDDRIPVLSDGWGQHDNDSEKSSAYLAPRNGLDAWKQSLKTSEESLGMKGLMAKQKGLGTKHSELNDARTASRDGWLR